MYQRSLTSLTLLFKSVSKARGLVFVLLLENVCIDFDESFHRSIHEQEAFWKWNYDQLKTCFGKVLNVIIFSRVCSYG